MSLAGQLPQAELLESPTDLLQAHDVPPNTLDVRVDAQPLVSELMS